MGVPSFFKWILDKYKNVVVPAEEEVGGEDSAAWKSFVDAHGHAPPGPGGRVDLTAPNPNGFEIDNLYIDMNGMIHPCFHPEERPAPRNEAEVFEEVFLYLDRIMSICRPRRLLFLAIDGPAPRAKLNQQRSRRYYSAYERQRRTRHFPGELGAGDAGGGEEAGEAGGAGDANGAKESGPPAPGEENAEGYKLDSNYITPGTPFMLRLTQAVKYYVISRQNSPDPTTAAFWQRLAVVFTDSNTAGEGEHKIMSFIRQQRSRPGYRPNMVHCIHGLDADLIMLALGTHERYFTILREIVFQASDSMICTRCGQVCSSHNREGQLHGMVGSEDDEEDGDGDGNGEEGRGGGPRGRRGGFSLSGSIQRHPAFCPHFSGVDMRPVVYHKAFQFLHVWQLRANLGVEFRLAGRELENAIDDFIFLCYMAGNDFLPNIPCLVIREAAVFRIIDYYVEYISQGKKFLTTATRGVPYVLIGNLAAILSKLASREDYIYQARERRSRFSSPDSQAESLQRKISDIESALATAELTPAEREACQRQLEDSRHSLERIRFSQEVKRESRRAGAFEDRHGGASGTAPGSSAGAPEGDRPADHSTSREEAMMTDPRIPPEGILENQYYKWVTIAPEDCTTLAVRYIALPYNLGRANYRRTYYTAIGVVGEDAIAAMADAYVLGMQWVYCYYYWPRCPDWGWFYPYHFAPLARDLEAAVVRAARKSPCPFSPRNDTRPFTPYEQLLAVLPPASCDALPEPYHALMLEKSSPLAGFYPNRFDADMSSGGPAWHAKLLLPFIDEKTLRAEAARVFEGLRDPILRARNTFVDPVIIVHKNHPDFQALSFMAGSTPMERGAALEAMRSLPFPEGLQLLDAGPSPGAPPAAGAGVRRVCSTTFVDSVRRLSGTYSPTRTDFFRFGVEVVPPLWLPGQNGTMDYMDCTSGRGEEYVAQGDFRGIYASPESYRVRSESIAVRYLPPPAPEGWIACRLFDEGSDTIRAQAAPVRGRRQKLIGEDEYERAGKRRSAGYG